MSVHSNDSQSAWELKTVLSYPYTTIGCSHHLEESHVCTTKRVVAPPGLEPGSSGFSAEEHGQLSDSRTADD